MKQTLYFATSNNEKFKEAQAILSYPLKRAEIFLDEIQDASIHQVVKRKVEDAFSLLEKPVFVDDVGLYIDVWDGFPGPFVKFLMKDNKNDLMLYMMRNETNIKVRVVSAVGFCDGKNTEVFIGDVTGNLATSERGPEGWGLDPVVIPDGFNKTWAELGDKIKNTKSHRHNSLEKLEKFLKGYWK
jgi:XTP/dITP diphosphohydrolase